MLSIIWAIIIGFIVGLFARLLMPGKDPVGIISTTLLGIGGAVVGTLLGQVFGFYREGHTAGFFMSLLGAMILLSLYNHFVRKNTVP